MQLYPRQQARQLLYMHDLNRDGRVHRSEFDYFQDQAALMHGTVTTQGQRQFAQAMDMNGDNYYSIREFHVGVVVGSIKDTLMEAMGMPSFHPMSKHFTKLFFHLVNAFLP